MSIKKVDKMSGMAKSVLNLNLIEEMARGNERVASGTTLALVARVRELEASLKEANALSKARDAETERSLEVSRDHREISIEWRRRYEMEVVISTRAFDARDALLRVIKKPIGERIGMYD